MNEWWNWKDSGPQRIKRHAFYSPTGEIHEKCASEGCGLLWESEVHWVLDESPIRGTDEVVTRQEDETPPPAKKDE